jgi:flagellar motor switch protein FliN/FliY
MTAKLGATDALPTGELEPNTLLDMRLRVWAEIGRAQMPAAFVVGMPKGAIIDLDCGPDEPADLFVNGRHFGTGRLVLVDGEWALRVETLDEYGDPGVEQTSSPDSDSAEAAE